MTCPQCSFENPAGARFCQECGSSLSGRCSGCGNSVAPSAKFCTSCGRPTGLVATPLPSTYTPRHLAEKILRTRALVEGERKQVTVLFADVKESMSLAETVDPETWHRIMDEFFAILSAGVHRFEGSVNQYTGDGIMALFGAPIAHEDHAQRACYAALALLDELARYSEQLRREEGLSFSVRLGINSGEVVIGRIGEDLRMDYTAQGHTVGLASRMEQLAAPNCCYVSEHTSALVGDYFDLRDLGPFRVKGVSEPMRVFELQGIGRHRTRLDVSRARGLSRFVGRHDEMQRLDAALAATRTGDPRVVGVVAEPGAGKSRLCAEFVEKAARAGIRVLTGHCVPHGALLPFHPVLELLRAYFGIEEGDAPKTAREKIAGRMLLLDESMRTSLPLVFDFLGVPDPERPVPALDPEPRRRMLYGALRRTLECGAADQAPTVMLVEDMHWCDGASLAFFGDMISVLPGSCEMVLMNYRPEFSPPWGDNAAFEQIALAPLGPAEVGAILRDLVGSDPSTEPLVRNIEKATAGNPFFVEELVHALVEAGSLEGTRGDYRLVRPVEDILLPPTVHAVLAARIDHLPERQKEVLHSAAVIGKKFSQAVLERIVRVDRAELGGALDALCEAGFLVEREVYPAARYAFQHPLTQEVAYRTQLGDKRRGLHLTIARTLVELEPDRVDENSALLAHHWEAASEWLEATAAYRRAAERASSTEMRESRRHWQKVVELIDRLDPDESTVDLALAAMEGMLSLCWRLGLGRDEAERLYRWGEEWGARSTRAETVARLRGAWGAWHIFTGDIDSALSIYAEANTLVAGSGDRVLRTTLKSRLSYACLLAGKLREAQRLNREVLEGIGEDGPMPGVAFNDWVFMMSFSGLVLTYLGRLAEAGHILERCLQLAIDAGDRGGANSSRGFGVTLAWFTGDAATAMSHARAQIEFAERIASPALRAGAYDSLGIAHLLRGEWHEAVRCLETALATSRETGTFLQAEALVLANMADAYRGSGDLDRAVDVAREAVEVARTRRTRMHECRASLFLGRALVARGEPADLMEAESALADAMGIVTRTEARAYEPHVRAELARLAAARGDAAVQRREVAHAAALFRDLGAEARALEVEGRSAAA